MRTILVRYRDSQGGLDHMMTTDAARELVEECWVSHCWIYADNHLIQGDQASENIDWETVSQIRILPALVSDSTMSPHVGDEE